MSGHIGKRDLRATRLAFLLFVSLIVNFVYLVVYMIGGYFNNVRQTIIEKYIKSNSGTNSYLHLVLQLCAEFHACINQSMVFTTA